MRGVRLILAGVAAAAVVWFFLVATGAVGDPAERQVETTRQAPRAAAEAVPGTVPAQVPAPEPPAPETVFVDRAYVPAACTEAIRLGDQVVALAVEGQAVASELTAYLSSLSADVTYGEAYPTISGFYGRANDIAGRSAGLAAAWQTAAAGCHG